MGQLSVDRLGGSKTLRTWPNSKAEREKLFKKIPNGLAGYDYDALPVGEYKAPFLITRTEFSLSVTAEHLRRLATPGAYFDSALIDARVATFPEFQTPDLFNGLLKPVLVFGAMEGTRVSSKHELHFYMGSFSLA
jgi:hypothetical protein